MRNSKGFTLFEIIIVISIISILASVLVVGFFNFRTHRSFELATKETRQIFENARSMTLAAVDDSAYGVFIGERELILFKGEEYEEEEMVDIVELPPKVIISQISFSPQANEIAFKRGTGEASSAGYIELSIINEVDKKHRVTISKQGIITSNE